MTGQTTHPDSDVLAEFRAGLITGRRGDRVAAHLAVCDRCAALSDQLAEISVLLAAVPAPTVPDSVAQRLDLVLAAEQASRDDSERAGSSGSRDRVTDTRRPNRSSRWRLVALRVLAPAAAVIVLAAGGYGLSRIVAGGPTSSTAARSAAAAAPTAIAGAANGAESHPGLSPEIKGSQGSSVINSGTDYQPAELRQQLEQERRAPAGLSQPASAQLQACVYRVTRGVSPGKAVLLENAHYQGRPATVIVASSGSSYRAWVLAPGCSGTHDDVLATATLAGTSAP